MEYINAPFNPIRAIVMSELGNRDKGVYYNLLANNNATFARDSQGRIVANVRLLAENVVTSRQKKVASAEQKAGTVHNLFHIFIETIIFWCIKIV